MSRYIDADALKEQMLKYGFHSVDQTVTEFVEDTLPTADVVEREKWDRLLENSIILAAAIQTYQSADMVEVVRCCDADKGDCMFNHWHTTPNGEKYHICNLNKLSFSEHADFFCKYGERREDDKGND